ncbi:uncharacterized protein HMPREF1541_02943 [Cyphellophora europaea CBS 101466]|uniref:Xylanolytic transcriptional activator regulatory domain-containing protein n=1 Tax=Cyphellophora europaea (strain CBS 101466) TaxID=1220924 RepID=W2RXG7_CYPE1|nr:uncharacterized protein HMPREF1541_02943 [Cyphellophora europaea CBS 101466]ETN41010.1 hypothetical protein HMPREF1541_02943 [Cyphellophora europaea CBS 101466]
MSEIRASYHFRRPAPPQTQRIQMLEVHLRYVRSFLQDAARKVPPELGIDFEDVLRKISSAAPDVPSPGHDGDVVSRSAFKDLLEPDNAYNNIVSPLDPQGPSQFSFMLQLVQAISGSGNLSDSESSVLESLFSGPLPDIDDMDRVSLPPRQLSMSLIDALFAGQHTMPIFLHERYFRDMVDLVYKVQSSHDAIDRFLPLLHFTLALGYLYAKPEHQAAGCENAHREAFRHYQAGQELLQPLDMSSLNGLQTVLCGIAFLISTCRLTVAHPLIGVACSLALRLGLHTKSDGLSSEEQQLRLRVFAAVLHADLYASLVMGLPTFLHPQKSSLALLDELALAAYHQRDWYTASTTAQVQLLVLAKAIGDSMMSAEGSETGGSSNAYVGIKDAAARLRSWRDGVRPLLYQLETSEPATVFKYELEMLYNFSCLVLWRPSLLDLCNKVNMGKAFDLASSEVTFAGACIRSASATTSRSRELAQNGSLSPVSWPAIYTIFLSCVFLTALLPLDDLASGLDDMYRPLTEGLKLLVECRCGDAIASSSFQVLKMMISRLPDAQSIDVDGIEASASGSCGDHQQDIDMGEHAPGRQDDILSLLNARSQETVSIGTKSRSPPSMQ